MDSSIKPGDIIYHLSVRESSKKTGQIEIEIKPFCTVLRVSKLRVYYATPRHNSFIEKKKIEQTPTYEKIIWSLGFQTYVLDKGNAEEIVRKAVEFFLIKAKSDVEKAQNRVSSIETYLKSKVERVQFPEPEKE